MLLLRILQAVERGRLIAGIKCTDGVLLCALKEVSERDAWLSDAHVPRKFFTIDQHIHCTACGLMPDAVSLVDKARSIAAQHARVFGSGIPLQRLASLLGSHKQEMTQKFGSRPMGAALMLAGYDDQNGFGLYTTSPTGMYQAWRAASVGEGAEAVRSVLQQEYPQLRSMAETWPLFKKAIREHLKRHGRPQHRHPPSQVIEMASSSRLPDPGRPISWHVYDAQEVDQAFAE